MKVTIGYKHRLPPGKVRFDPDIGTKILSLGRYEVLEVFNRGRYASVEVSPCELAQLQDRLGSICTFQKTLKAAAFRRSA